MRLIHTQKFNVDWSQSYGTADFQPIEIVVRHGVDDVTYLIREDQIYLRLQPDSTLMI